MFSDKITKSIALAASQVIDESAQKLKPKVVTTEGHTADHMAGYRDDDAADDDNGDKSSELSVGTELRVNGKRCVVDEIVGDTAYCTDEDGGDVEVYIDGDWDLISEDHKAGHKDITVGTELRVDGKWCVVDEILGDTAWCTDEDGGDVEVNLSGSNWDLVSESHKATDWSKEMVIEALKGNQPTSEWINDFINSNDAKFKGKSRGERINMAMAAFFEAQKAVNKAGSTVREGIEEPAASGERKFKGAHLVNKSADVNQDDQSGIEAMGDCKPKLPMGTSFSKAEDIDGEKRDLANVAAIKASAKRATAPSAQGNPKIDEIDGEKTEIKTTAAIKKSASRNASDPKASGSKQSGAQSAEKVANTAPSGKLGADEPKAKQRFSEPMPKRLKEMAMVALLGEDADVMTTFDKQYANDHAESLKQLIAGQGTEGIDVELMPQFNHFIASYGDELRKHFKLPVADDGNKDVKESATKDAVIDQMNAEAETKSETKSSRLADQCEEAASRVAGLINRKNEAPPGIQSKIEQAQRLLSFVAEWLDNDDRRNSSLKEGMSETKGSKLADRAVLRAERVAGLISRRIESDKDIIQKIQDADDNLLLVAEFLDNRRSSKRSL